MDNIIAVLYTPVGISSNRHWRAFSFDTADRIIVEQFMQMVYQADYFLATFNDLERDDRGRLVHRGMWVYAMPVGVNVLDNHVTFTIGDL